MAGVNRNTDLSLDFHLIIPFYWGVGDPTLFKTSRSSGSWTHVSVQVEDAMWPARDRGQHLWCIAHHKHVTVINGIGKSIRGNL